MSERSTSSPILASLVIGAGCLGMLAWAGVVIVWTLAMLGASFAFLEDYWGWHPILSVVVVTLLLFAFPFLLVPAAFFGAWLVWEWPFLGALAFAAPGLVFAAVVLAGGGTIEFFGRLFAFRSGRDGG